MGDQTEQLRRLRDDLRIAANRYLERARSAEAERDALAARVAALTVSYENAVTNRNYYAEERKKAEARVAVLEGQGEPVAMILHCPACGKRHIDEATPEWDNPPHRSHLCLGCGHIWRPADVPTVGVAALKTKGKADHPTPEALAPTEVWVLQRNDFPHAVYFNEAQAKVELERQRAAEVQWREDNKHVADVRTYWNLHKADCPK